MYKRKTWKGKMLKRREECDTYLTHIRREPGEKIKYKELSANTVAFISCSYSPAMSTDMSQVGVALFSCF